MLRADARAAPHIEADVKSVKHALDVVAPASHILGVRNLVLFGPDGDGYAVFIGTTDIEHLLSALAQGAHIHISGEIRASDMPEVNRTVGVGQCRGNEVADHARSLAYSQGRISPQVEHRGVRA